MSLIEWTDDQLLRAGMSKRRLVALVKSLRKCSETMSELGLELYGCDSTGYLVHKSRPTHDREGVPDMGSIVADIGFGFNGGGW